MGGKYHRHMLYEILANVRIDNIILLLDLSLSPKLMFYFFWFHYYH